MKKALLELDPQSDALLILQKPNLHQVHTSTDTDTSYTNTTAKNIMPIWLETQQNDATKKPETIDEMRRLQPYLENGDPNQVVFHVSAKHLCIVSQVFRNMIQGEFKESKPNDEGLLEIRTSEWNAEALLIVLDIIHGHHHNVPQKPSLKMIAQVVFIVDYYDCFEVANIFFERWLSRIKKGKNYPCWLSRGLVVMDKGDFGYREMTMLYMAWVVRDEQCFEALTRVAMITKHALTETDLPIPPKLLEAIENKRCEMLDQRFDKLYQLQEDLIAGRVGCCLECSCRLLGYLTKQMHQNNLPMTKPDKPFSGHRVISLAKMINGIKTPTWRNPRIGMFDSLVDPEMANRKVDHCKLERSLAMYQKEGSLGIATPGLDLKDF